MGGDQSGFDENGSRPAHRIYKVGFSVPPRFQYHSGGQYFVDGGFGLSHAVSSLVQRLSRTVERQRAAHVRYMEIQYEFRSVQPHRRSFACLLHEIVGNGIFRSVGHEFGMFETVGIGDGVDRECRFGRKQGIPFERFHFFIDFVGVRCFEFINRFQYSQSCSTGQIGFVKKGLVSVEGYHSSTYFYILGSQIF